MEALKAVLRERGVAFTEMSADRIRVENCDESATGIDAELSGIDIDVFHDEHRERWYGVSGFVGGFGSAGFVKTPEEVLRWVSGEAIADKFAECLTPAEVSLGPEVFRADYHQPGERAFAQPCYGIDGRIIGMTVHYPCTDHAVHYVDRLQFDRISRTTVPGSYFYAEGGFPDYWVHESRSRRTLRGQYRALLAHQFALDCRMRQVVAEQAEITAELGEVEARVAAAKGRVARLERRRHGK